MMHQPVSLGPGAKEPTNRDLFACYALGRGQKRKGYSKPRIPPKMCERRAAWLIEGYESGS